MGGKQVAGKAHLCPHVGGEIGINLPGGGKNIVTISAHLVFGHPDVDLGCTLQPAEHGSVQYGADSLLCHRDPAQVSGSTVLLNGNGYFFPGKFIQLAFRVKWLAQHGVHVLQQGSSPVLPRRALRKLADGYGVFLPGRVAEEDHRHLRACAEGDKAKGFADIIVQAVAYAGVFSELLQVSSRHRFRRGQVNILLLNYTVYKLIVHKLTSCA